MPRRILYKTWCTHRALDSLPRASIFCGSHGANNRDLHFAFEMPDSSHHFTMSRQFAKRFADTITDCLHQTERRRSIKRPRKFNPPISCWIDKNPDLVPNMVISAYNPGWPNKAPYLTIYQTGVGCGFEVTRQFAKCIAATINECLEKTK